MKLTSLFFTALTQRINSIFASSQELRLISGKVQQLRAFQLHYEKIAPPSFLRSSYVAQIERNIITLMTSNSAIAAKLRQMAPELIQQLQLLGCEVTGIQVKVQVTLSQNRHLQTTPASISNSVKLQLDTFSNSLEDSPLKAALQRLARIRPDK